MFLITDQLTRYRIDDLHRAAAQARRHHNPSAGARIVPSQRLSRTGRHLRDTAR